MLTKGSQDKQSILVIQVPHSSELAKRNSQLKLSKLQMARDNFRNILPQIGDLAYWKLKMPTLITTTIDFI